MPTISGRISVLIFLLATLAVWPAGAAAPPNIVFILADDLGWADVDFHGGKVPTPNLNRLRTEGMELLQHYVYPVCSPTRAALLSGRYASRFGVTTPQNTRAYPWETITLARALKSVGYETALCGKWHLGSKPDWGPNHFGFDHSYGSLAGGVGPWDHRYKKGEFTQTWQRNGVLIEEQGHVTDLITAEAISWLASRGHAPFFLYVPYSAVHIPIREPEGYLKRVPREITDPSHREYLACVLHLDVAVGQLLAALDQTGKANNTLVVFTSDNGGVNTARNDAESYPADNYTPGTAHGNNQPLRGQKGSVYEGGIRVPTLVRWPGHVQGTSSAEPVHITDWMPTFCRLAGYQPDRDLHWDGRDVMPLLTGAGVPKSRTIYVAGPGFTELSLREGDWKLIVHQDKPAFRGELAPKKLELFDLATDPKETTDLSADQPDRVKDLLTKLRLAAAADHTATVAE